MIYLLVQENFMKPRKISPITLLDVKHALGNIDPNTTHAGAVRQILGRGSHTTIQKHLDTIRIEKKVSMRSAAPPLLLEIVNELWESTLAEVRVMALTHIERSTLEQNNLLKIKDSVLSKSLTEALEAAEKLVIAQGKALSAAHAQSIILNKRNILLIEKLAEVQKELEQVKGLVN